MKMGLREWQDKREYFRIRDTLSVSLRLLTEEEFIRLKKVIRYTPTAFMENIDKSGIVMERILKKIEEKDELFMYLSILDKKLNHLMTSFLSIKDDPYSHSGYREVDISGSGIKIYNPEPYEVGTYFELKIYIPMVTYPRISTLSQVVRVDEEKKDDKITYLIAFKFLEINENDRDLLIKYIFMKDRERLRSERIAYR